MKILCPSCILIVLFVKEIHISVMSRYQLCLKGVGSIEYCLSSGAASIRIVVSFQLFCSCSILF